MHFVLTPTSPTVTHACHSTHHHHNPAGTRPVTTLGSSSKPLVCDYGVQSGKSPQWVSKEVMTVLSHHRPDSGLVKAPSGVLHYPADWGPLKAPHGNPSNDIHDSEPLATVFSGTNVACPCTRCALVLCSSLLRSCTLTRVTCMNNSRKNMQTACKHTLTCLPFF